MKKLTLYLLLLSMLLSLVACGGGGGGTETTTDSGATTVSSSTEDGVNPNEPAVILTPYNGYWVGVTNIDNQPVYSPAFQEQHMVSEQIFNTDLVERFKEVTSDFSMVIDGTRRVFEYYKTEAYSDGAASRVYQSELGDVICDRTTGELTYMSLSKSAFSSADRQALSRDECQEIAFSCLQSYIDAYDKEVDLSKYSLTTITPNQGSDESDYTIYKFKYVRLLDGYQTDEFFSVSVGEYGDVHKFAIGEPFGSFDLAEGKIDFESTYNAAFEVAEKVREEFAKYQFTYEFVGSPYLCKLDCGSYAVEYIVKVSWDKTDAGGYHELTQFIYVPVL
ncbi:MAG: hypothetical protein IJX13_06830 [Clostridia bacterium]|nr:hypothetical protein [Clostridia bacterium]